MDFNTDQFREPGRGQRAFRGFGDQAMARYRVTPPAQPTPPPAPAPAPASQGQQTSLFQAAEVRNPQGPPPPTFNADQFRISRPALPGMSTRSMASQRVTPTAEAPQPTAAPSPRTWTQPEITMLGPTPASTSSPGAAGPTPTRWPTPASTPESRPASHRPPVTINRSAYEAVGRRFGPPEPSPAPASAAPTRPAASTSPATDAPRPASPASGHQAPAWAGRAARWGGLGIGLAARAVKSMNDHANDVANSGNPQFKTRGGWAKS